MPQYNQSTTLDTQNEVLEVFHETRNRSGRVTVRVTGTFSAGDAEFGYKTADGTFTVDTDATLSAAGGFELSLGLGIRLFGRATGASPSLEVDVASLQAT